MLQFRQTSLFFLKYRVRGKFSGQTEVIDFGFKLRVASYINKFQTSSPKFLSIELFCANREQVELNCITKRALQDSIWFNYSGKTRFKIFSMPINQNHLFEDLNGVKCSIVEKNASKERVEFLKSILEYNKFTVVIVPSPPPKAVPPPVNPSAEQALPVAEPPLPETFTIGVTDVMFNPTNAIFGRLLRTPDGHIVTLAYWNQKEKESRDDIPYFKGK
jgi:hypothetical protein